MSADVDLIREWLKKWQLPSGVGARYAACVGRRRGEDFSRGEAAVARTAHYPKIVKDNVMRKETANIIDEESFCPFVSWLLLWHWLSVDKIDRKMRTAVRKIITKVKLISVRCYFINFLRGNVSLIDTSRDN